MQTINVYIVNKLFGGHDRVNGKNVLDFGLDTRRNI